MRCNLEIDPSKFQSTPPCEGATHDLVADKIEQLVSIHAPV